MATNADPTVTSCTVNHQQKDGTQLPYSCPQCIPLYNKFMRGVDRGDQLRGYYSFRTKCRKLYKYIFWFAMDVAITNAYIMYREEYPNNKVKCMKSFCLEVAQGLIGSCTTKKKPERTSTDTTALSLLHFPVKGNAETEGRNKWYACNLCRHHKKTNRYIMEV